MTFDEFYFWLLFTILYGGAFIESLVPLLKNKGRKFDCTDCVLDGTDACPRGAGRAVDSEVCEDFLKASE